MAAEPLVDRGVLVVAVVVGVVVGVVVAVVVGVVAVAVDDDGLVVVVGLVAGVAVVDEVAAGVAVVDEPEVEAVVRLVTAEEWAVVPDATTTPSPTAPAVAATPMPNVARRTLAIARSRERDARLVEFLG